ncbi:MAG: N-6 DNA methylase [Eubacteriales bacterium]|nr:N-6 DNA methylase [Eubacteriales bacterium]
MTHYALLPTVFGVEAACKAELLDLGYKPAAIEVSDGQLKLKLGENWQSELFRLNLSLRTAERVRLEILSAEITEFEDYYETLKAFNFEDWILPGQRIKIKGSSRKSKLFAVSSLQSLGKKAIVDRLLAKRHKGSSYLEERADASEIDFYFSFIRDKLSLSIDTTGPALHKRGYRPLNHLAPLRETLAAAILYYAHYENSLRFEEALYDPFCGSGTFLIEAAMIAKQMAPGLRRQFSMEALAFAKKSEFAKLRQELEAKISRDYKLRIYGSEISQKVLEVAAENIRRAGLAEAGIELKQIDFRQLKSNSLHRWPGGRGLIVANLPYGERLGEEAEARDLTKMLLDLALAEKGERAWQLAFLQLPKIMPRNLPRADRQRKLYNGSMAVQLYQYYRHCR